MYGNPGQVWAKQLLSTEAEHIRDNCKASKTQIFFRYFPSPNKQVTWNELFASHKQVTRSYFFEDQLRWHWHCQPHKCNPKEMFSVTVSSGKKCATFSVSCCLTTWLVIIMIYIGFKKKWAWQLTTSLMCIANCAQVCMHTFRHTQTIQHVICIKHKHPVVLETCDLNTSGFKQLDEKRS